MINEKLAELVERKEARRIARDAALARVRLKQGGKLFKVRKGANLRWANAKAVEDS